MYNLTLAKTTSFCESFVTKIGSILLLILVLLPIQSISQIQNASFQFDQSNKNEIVTNPTTLFTLLLATLGFLVLAGFACILFSCFKVNNDRDNAHLI
jgi:hypothetical protein